MFLTLFAGSVIMGWIGSYYERMTPTAFWALTAAIAGLGAMIWFVFERPLTRALADNSR